MSPLLLDGGQGAPLQDREQPSRGLLRLRVDLLLLTRHRHGEPRDEPVGEIGEHLLLAAAQDHRHDPGPEPIEVTVGGGPARTVERGELLVEPPQRSEELWVHHLHEAVAACTAAATGGRSEVKAGANVVLRLERVVSRGDSPGIQYVVVDPHSTLFEGAVGWADLVARRPLEPGTTMMAYSMTKTITAAAVLQLVEKGALTLDTPVRALLSDIPYGDRLTIRHLLGQTSGIPNPIPLKWVHLPEEHAAYDEQAMLARRLTESPGLRFSPGERYAYSNLSYWLVGRVVEKVSGVPYQEYVRANIFARLGLPPAEIGFVIPARERQAKGYLPMWSLWNLLKPFLIDRKFIGEYEGSWLHVNDNYLDGAAFGGIVASARSMGRFLQDQLAPESVVLGQEGRRMFFEQQKDNAGEPVETTLGWHVAPRGAGYFFKEGGGAGFHAEMRVYRTSGFASVVIANNGSFDVNGFLDATDREFTR
jgi:D-alanyl-D-alanine carboxypeptidase